MNDVCISSRVRLARNISGFEFPNKLQGKAREKLLENVFEAIDKSKFRLIKKEDLAEKILGSLQEKNLVSLDFIMSNYNGLAISKTEEECVMVNEEDHIRIQVLKRGLSLKQCLIQANEIDDELSQMLNFAYSEELGYLTSCPTNLGTGMRASVMMFLPALTTTNNIPSLIESVNKLGFTVRGINGEGSKMEGFLYQISNMYTLGLSEDDIINKVESIVKKIEKLELEQRQNVLSQDIDNLTDNLFRSYGTLTNSYLMSSEEAIKLLSKVKYGVELGILKINDFDLLDAITSVQKYNLMISCNKDLSELERDKERAKLLITKFNCYKG